MKSRPRIIKSHNVYSGEISVKAAKFRVNGRFAMKEYIQYSNSVGIIPIDNNNNLLLIRQYRFAANKSLIEIPAGKIENGEKPKMAALRELNEETGYTGRLTPITQWYLAPGYSTEKMYLFLATDLKKIKNRLAMDHDETIKLIRVDLQTALKKCIRGEIEDCKTISGLMLYSQLNHVIPNQNESN